MVETIVEYLSYPFVRNALVAGVLISLCAALLGVPLVLRRLSFIGDGLSHVAFGAMAVAAVMNFADTMALSLPVTIAAALILMRSGRGAKTGGDAMLAMLSVGAMAPPFLDLTRILYYTSIFAVKSAYRVPRDFYARKRGMAPSNRAFHRHAGHERGLRRSRFSLHPNFPKMRTHGFGNFWYTIRQLKLKQKGNANERRHGVRDKC